MLCVCVRQRMHVLSLHLQLCVFLCFHFVHGHTVKELNGDGIVRGLETRTIDVKMFVL